MKNEELIRFNPILAATATNSSRKGRIGFKNWSFVDFSFGYCASPLIGDDKETETTIEHRYTISIDPAWFKNDGVVALELGSQCYSVKTGNRLDNVGSIVEFSQAPDGEESDVSVLVVDPTGTEDSWSHEEALIIRCK